MDLKIINGVNSIILMKQPKNDLKRLIKDFQFDAGDQKLLQQLENYSGKMVLWDEVDINSESGKIYDCVFQGYVTPFKVAEEGEKFFDLYRQHFPDKLVQQTEVKDYFEARKDEGLQRNKKRLEELKTQEEMTEKLKSEKEKQSEKIKILENKLQRSTEMKKSELIKTVIELHKQGLSYREIGEKTGTSPATVMRYIKKEEKNVDV